MLSPPIGQIHPFREVIDQLSEPESGPSADNLVSNEDSYPRVAGELDRLAHRGGVYLGVGPDQNFTLMAHAHPAFAVILDFRRRNRLLHLLHKALFTFSTDRVAYLTHLLARRPGGLPADPDAEQLVTGFEGSLMDRPLLDETVGKVRRFLEPLGVIRDDEWPALATIQARLAGPGLNVRFLALPMYPTLARLIRTTDRDGNHAHVLSQESTYLVVRRAQVEGRVFPLVGDFASPTSLPRVGDWLRDQSQKVAVFYISDVEFFLIRSGRLARYAENLARLPWSDHALLVRTSTREINHPSRVAGDSSTTIVRPVAPFLDAARSGRIRSVDDLFIP